MRHKCVLPIPTLSSEVVFFLTCFLSLALAAQTNGSDKTSPNPDLPLLNALSARILGGAIFSNSPAVVSSTAGANG